MGRPRAFAETPTHAYCFILNKYKPYKVLESIERYSFNCINVTVIIT